MRAGFAAAVAVAVAPLTLVRRSTAGAGAGAAAAPAVVVAGLAFVAEVHGRVREQSDPPTGSRMRVDAELETRLNGGAAVVVIAGGRLARHRIVDSVFRRERALYADVEAEIRVDDGARHEMKNQIDAGFAHD